MKILLVGISCVGKTTIGKRLAERLCCKFFDLDEEIEKFFNKSIGRLKSELLTEYSFRKEAAMVLSNILMNEDKDNQSCVVALPPSGLMDSYYKVIRKAKCITVVLQDTPENILSRITFYTIDSKPIQVTLTESQRSRYLKETKEDMKYFNKFYKKANVKVDISGLNIEKSAQKIETLVKNYQPNKAINSDAAKRGAGYGCRYTSDLARPDS